MADQNDDFQQQVPPQDDPAPQPQPQDFGTPAADPADSQGALNAEHPATDSGLEPSEQYDEGLGDAAIDSPPAPEPPADEQPAAPLIPSSDEEDVDKA